VDGEEIAGNSDEDIDESIVKVLVEDYDQKVNKVDGGRNMVIFDGLRFGPRATSSFVNF
jgi:hypothetical protein